MSGLVDPSQAAVALAECERITRARARNFYYGLKLTPQPQRSAMFAVYAWMRMADDLVDAEGIAGDERRRRVEELKRRTEALLSGEPLPQEFRHEAVWVAMADTAARFRLRAEHFEGMIEGQLEDLEHREYDTFEELHGFCYRVASTVGLVCIDIWGHHDARARELAIDRGVAFQLTNILRDVREDLDRGRVYLPKAELTEAGLTADALRRWEDPARCHAFVLRQAQRAEHYYRRSAALESMITPSCVPTLWAMSRIYHGLLEKILARPKAIVGERRIRLSSLHKAAIALKARRLASIARESSAVVARPSTT
ncbi:MAG: phytoene/squalene synthase family protein [Phycisphaerales bacterium]|nr:phytoene/squalene synthase family protein [Phycisphaerales bacterium]